MSKRIDIRLDPKQIDREKPEVQEALLRLWRKSQAEQEEASKPDIHPGKVLKVVSRFTSEDRKAEWDKIQKRGSIDVTHLTKGKQT